MRALLLSSVVLFGCVESSTADDMSNRFAGPSIGITLNGTQSQPKINGYRADELDDSQFDGGIYVGYDWQNGSSVVGGIVDFDYVDMASSGKADITDYTYDVDWVASARMRAGFTPTPDSLVYLTGGVAAGQFSATAVPFFGTPSEADDIKLGAVAGVGFEYAWDNGLLAKSELLYYGFKSLDLGGSSLSPSFTTLKLGVGYRF